MHIFLSVSQVCAKQGFRSGAEKHQHSTLFPSEVLQQVLKPAVESQGLHTVTNWGYHTFACQNLHLYVLVLLLFPAGVLCKTAFCIS